LIGNDKVANLSQLHLNRPLDQSAPATLNYTDLFDAIQFTAAASPVADATPAAPAQALYLSEPGDASAISVYDINQGSMNDCFVLSPIGEIAMLSPKFIANKIQGNANGTETVTLYTAANGSLPNSRTSDFAPIDETVTNIFPGGTVNSSATQDMVNGMKEIWPQGLENAIAQLDGGYGAFDPGGDAAYAMEELTGQVATSMAASRTTLATLLSLSSAGDLLVMSTLSKSALPDNLVSNHDYMFDGVTGSGSSAVVNLLNPWGYDDPLPIPFSQLSKGISSIFVGHLT
jgi:hypothetical protein